MGEIKPWQAVLFAAAIIVVGGVLAWMIFGQQRVQLADKLYLIDVPTGDLYYADVSGRGGVTVPAKHPDTLERTLIPVSRSDDGGWMISERYRPAIRRMVDKMKLVPADVIDQGNWTVTTVETGEARKYVSPLAG